MFEKKYHLIAAFFLTALFLLEGCSPKTAATGPTATPPAKTPVPQEEIVSDEGVWQGEGGCYRMSRSELGDSLRSIMVYEDEVYNLHYSFGSNDLALELRRGQEVLFRHLNMKSATVGSSGIWIVDDVADYGLVSSPEYHLVKLSPEGDALLYRDITKELSDTYVVGMLTDADGQILLLLNEKVLVYDKEGFLLGQIPLEGYAMSIVPGGGGIPYIVLQKEDSGDVSVVACPDTESFSVEYLAEYQDYKICGGNEEYLYTLLNKEGLYGITSPGEKPVPIAIWTELGADFYNPSFISWLRGGSFILVDRNLTALLTPGDPAGIKRKTHLTLACVSKDFSFKRMVEDFNMSNHEYIVNLKDYSRNGELSPHEALQALNMDILTGNAPDLLDLSYIPQSYFAAKGLLADISVYLEQDSALNPEDFILFDKLKTDGHLYFVTNSYYIETAAGLTSVFEDSTGISLEKYLELQSRYDGDIMYNVTRESFLRNQVYRYITYSVDWKAATCNFESEEFLKILTTTKKIRENPEPENPDDIDDTPAGQRLAEGSLILNLCFVDKVTSLARLEAETGESLSFVGLPTSDGFGGTRLYTASLLGICSKGRTEDSWSFLKYYLTKNAEEIRDFGIPASRRTLEEQIAAALTLSQGGGDAIPFDGEQVEQLYDVLDSSVYYGTASEDILNIVMEEADAFLSGDKGVEETAHIIQSRVSILVAE